VKLTFFVFVFAVVSFSFSGGAAAEGKIGVVLMHGKGGMTQPSSPAGKLAERLRDAGILVAIPDMPWSRLRRFDKTYEETMAEIDIYVAQLKAKGAARIVIAGHSLGANAALGYGARRAGLAGIVAMAPGHFIDHQEFQDRVDHDYRKARERVENSMDDETFPYRDFNQGKVSVRIMTAKNYLSWFDPKGPAAMNMNTANLKPGTPLLWIYGRKDKLQKIRNSRRVFARAPDHPKNAIIIVDGGHRDTPLRGAKRIIEWIWGL